MRTVAVTILGGIALLAASVAEAAPPTISPAPGSNFVDRTTCGFAVSVTYVVNGQTAKAFTDGRTIVTGPLAASFAANGTIVTLNISGPATITATGSSVTIVGHGLGAGPVSAPDGGVTLGYLA